MLFQLIMLLPPTTNVAEGDSVTFTINTTDVGDGTTLYWRLVQYGSNDPVSTQYGFTTVVNSTDFDPTKVVVTLI